MKQFLFSLNCHVTWQVNAISSKATPLSNGISYISAQISGCAGVVEKPLCNFLGQLSVQLLPGVASCAPGFSNTLVCSRFKKKKKKALGIFVLLLIQNMAATALVCVFYFSCFPLGFFGRCYVQHTCLEES